MAQSSVKTLNIMPKKFVSSVGFSTARQPFKAPTVEANYTLQVKHILLQNDTTHACGINKVKCKRQA